MTGDIRKYQSAVDVIKTAILQSQARAAKAVNQEQLALYYGIGRYISMNTRNKNWGTGAIETISMQLRQELPGLRGFGVSSLKNMRTFYEAWQTIEPNSPIAIGELEEQSAESKKNLMEDADNKTDVIRQLQLANLPDFPLAEFLSISFTHHIRILENAKDTDERLFYVRYCHNYKPTTDDLPDLIKKQDLYHHQDRMPNNFLATIPDYKQAYRAIRMFKDEYLLDYINVEELGMHDEDVDERVIESNIVHNVKNFIMTFEQRICLSSAVTSRTIRRMRMPARWMHGRARRWRAATWRSLSVCSKRMPTATCRIWPRVPAVNWLSLH